MEAVVVLENFKNLPIEFFYNHIRFHAFPHISESNKKELFMKMGAAPLRSTEVFPKLIAAIQSNNFQEFQTVIERNIVHRKEIDNTYVRTLWQQILDCYFDDRDTLQALLFFRYAGAYPNPATIQDFLKEYRTSSPEERKYLVPSFIMEESI
jgi:hypothetical protein